MPRASARSLVSAVAATLAVAGIAASAEGQAIVDLLTGLPALVRCATPPSVHMARDPCSAAPRH